MSYKLLSTDSSILTNGLTEYVLEVNENTKELMTLQLPADQTQEQLDYFVDFNLKRNKELEERETKEREAINKALQELDIPEEAKS